MFIGFAFTSCTVPAKGTPTFVLEEDMMEFGVGIHGEPGIAKEKIVSADELAVKMIGKILNEGIYNENDEIALMINGLGGTAMQELYLLNNSVSKVLEEKKIRIYKTFVGNYMTSLEMAGASVTLLKLDEELKELLGAKADTSAMKI